MFLITQWFGSFLFDSDELVDHRLFPGTVDGISDRNRRIRSGEILQEERELASGREVLHVREIRLLGLENSEMIEEKDTEGDVDEEKEVGVEADGEQTHFPTVPDPEQFGMSMDLLQKALIQLSSEKLKKTLKSREIIECIAALDDLNRTVNLLRERESDWVRVYPDSEPPEIFGDFSSSINDLVSYRESLTTSIELMMREKNPTLSTLVGELLGARLIALAGGRERLSRLPSSTIQILGAENAFFRFRRTGKGMPKHGVIFQHPLIRNARRQDRGKIARALAAKIAIATRIDQYSDRDEGAFLKEALEKRIQRITHSE